MAMIKSELIFRVADRTPQLYQKDVEAVVSTILGRISDALVAGDRVELRGLGAFSVRARSSQERRNPKTGQAVAVEAKSTVAFRPSKVIKAQLNPSERPAEPKLKVTVSKLVRHA